MKKTATSQQTPLEKEIERLAREQGYPRRRLSHSEYTDVLKRAHDNVYKSEGNQPAPEPKQENKTLDVDSMDFYEVAYNYRFAAPVDQELTVKRFEELKQWIKKYGEQFQPAPTPAQEVDKHTPGKLKANRQGKSISMPFLLTNDKGIEIAEIHWGINEKLPETFDEIEANAARIVQCWNEFDGLKDQLATVSMKAMADALKARNLEKENEQLKEALTNLITELSPNYNFDPSRYPEILKKAYDILQTK